MGNGESVAFDELTIRPEQRHLLPFDKIKSRLSTATILSFKDRKKHVIILCLTLSQSSRAYIISQEGLPGFLFKNHTCIGSFLKELSWSVTFRNECDEDEELVMTNEDHANMTKYLTARTEP